MSLPMTLLLGFIAGVTILLGLPVGRMRKPAPSMRLLLNAIAVGVLVFLVWDVLSEAWAPRSATDCCSSRASPLVCSRWSGTSAGWAARSRQSPPAPPGGRRDPAP